MCKMNTQEYSLSLCFSPCEANTHVLFVSNNLLQCVESVCLFTITILHYMSAIYRYVYKICLQVGNMKETDRESGNHVWNEQTEICLYGRKVLVKYASFSEKNHKFPFIFSIIGCHACHSSDSVCNFFATKSNCTQNKLCFICGR